MLLLCPKVSASGWNMFPYLVPSWGDAGTLASKVFCAPRITPAQLPREQKSCQGSPSMFPQSSPR